MSGIAFSQKLGYGVGHVLNDLCASMWFTYLLLFYHKVLYFNNNYAGVVLLIGQVADGVSTTLVGLLCDGRDNSWLCRVYGRRKSWHLVGSLCILFSFPFIFLPCLGCRGSDEWAQMVYYAAFAVIFQFGWASVQISHLALIPSLSHSQNERTGLTALRYSMTVASNITVYLVALAFFGIGGNGDEITDKDEDKFRNIMLVCMGLGSCATLAFHLLVKEEVGPQYSPPQPIQNGDSVRRSTNPELALLPVSYWFTEPQFYLVALLYMSTRLFVNLSQAYMPLFIQESLELQNIYIAIIPLVMYSSGFLTSFIMKWLNRKAGRKVTYLLGALLAMATVLWVFCGAEDQPFFPIYGIFCVAAMFGAAGSTILVSSLALTAELIGRNTESAAFVYGAMSFTDKVSNGLAVMGIQYYIPCIKCCPDCKWYFRDVLFYACGGSALLGAVALLLLAPFKVGRRRGQAATTTFAVSTHNGQAETRNAAVNGASSERTPLLS